MSIFSFETILKIVEKILSVLVAALKAMHVFADKDDEDDENSSGE